MDRSLLENRVHGDAMFPLSIYDVTVSGDARARHLFNCHWHDELEFVMMREGKALFQIGAVNFEIAAGQAVFINSRELHAAYPVDHRPCLMDALVFNPNLLTSANYDILQNRFIDPLLRQEYQLPNLLDDGIPWQKEILNRLTQMLVIGRAKPFTYELMIKSQLYLIFSFMIANSERKITGKGEAGQQPDQTERIKVALQYIQTHYRQKINLRELAAAQHVSAAHFCRFFKQVVRKTPVDYINYYRIQKAARLLEEESCKITDVAMDVGFENFSYFIQTFKHYMKLTPSEYRKQRREASTPVNSPVGKF